MKAKSSSARRGLLAGGNCIIDQVKLIDVYPQREQLDNIRSQTRQGTGGAPYNVLVDVARTGANFPHFAAGLVGKGVLRPTTLKDGALHKVDDRFAGAT